MPRYFSVFSHLFLLVLMFFGSYSWGVVDVYEFDNDVDRQRYHAFVEELRCPKCQNQNLAGSNSPIAADLRRELYRLIGEGKSDKEITDFMVDRYGDYVLYNPKLQKSTWLLWFAPASLLLGGVLILLGVLSRRRARGDGVDKSPQTESLSPEQQRRLDALLGEQRDTSGKEE